MEETDNVALPAVFLASDDFRWISGDFASHDLEDFITVIDGRPSLLQEVGESTLELRTFLAEAVRGILSASRFLDALPGHL